MMKGWGHTLRRCWGIRLLESCFLGCGGGEGGLERIGLDRPIPSGFRLGIDGCQSGEAHPRQSPSDARGRWLRIFDLGNGQGAGVQHFP